MSGNVLFKIMVPSVCIRDSNGSSIVNCESSMMELASRYDGTFVSGFVSGAYWEIILRFSSNVDRQLVKDDLDNMTLWWELKKRGSYVLWEVDK